jgi:hypothetical protein
MKSFGVALIVLLCITNRSFGQSEPPAPVHTDHELLQKYVWSTLGLSGAIHATTASSLDQWRREPEEWGVGAGGYAKRWASEFAQEAIGNTTKYAVARVFHQDPSFARCGCSGFAPRLRHALTAPFRARTATGDWVFSPATVAGLAAENVIPPLTWYPSLHAVRQGAGNAAVSVVSKMGVDVFREFVTIPHVRLTP